MRNKTKIFGVTKFWKNAKFSRNDFSISRTPYNRNCNVFHWLQIELIKYTGNQGYIIFRIIPRREEGWGDFWRSSGKNWSLIASSSFYIFGLKVSLFCPENHLFFSIEQKKLKKLFFFVIININSHFKSCWRYHKSMYEEREIREQLIFVLNV